MSDYYSQWGQDKYIHEAFFQGKRNGVFLEIGADDGIRFSNCKFFEENLNWTGLAIEAREEAFNKLVANRNCICSNAVLSDKEGEADFFELKGYGIGLSGLVDKYDPRHVQRIRQEIKNPGCKGQSVIKVNTSRLDTLLDEHRILNIDFLSIDTEGSELAILETLDFDKYKIDIITIEDNYDDPNLMKFFVDRGYKCVKKIECDKIFSRL